LLDEKMKADGDRMNNIVQNNWDQIKKNRKNLMDEE
jgi:hypothetical protein